MESNFAQKKLPKVPLRKAVGWVSSNPNCVTCRCGIKSVIQGEQPIGLLPKGTIIKSEKERIAILEKLKTIPEVKYSSTDDDQSVRVWGKPFVDAKTVEEYLTAELDKEIVDLTEPLVRNLWTFLESKGFSVGLMFDPYTGLPYRPGVFRAINVVNEASVLHTDDFIRDGMKKSDFRLPKVLEGKEYFQGSFNVLLDTGGYNPDALWVHNRFYTPDDESQCMANGWQFPTSLVATQDVCRYEPAEGSEYFFSTSCYHDIRGGSKYANRITFSVFGVWVPSLNLFLLYN